MALAALRHIRRMRGGAQSHLIEASDGNFYVVKFSNNPQHRRILVNELISAVLLQSLQVLTPAVELIQIPADFADGYPGDPARVAVYDFVPDALLDRVHNLPDFLGVLAFDKWVSNGDARQCVYFRARVDTWPAGAVLSQKAAYVVSMIDHGFAFQGPNWEFVDAPLQGLYPRRIVYDRVRALDDFQPWLDRILHFPAEPIDDARKRVPLEWIRGEEDDLDRLLEGLYRRRPRIPELVRDPVRARAVPFANWRGD
jgi:hypothetical protein